MTILDYDVLILGQGLAGTALAWSLRQRGQRFLIIDRDAPGGSSRIAAGLMTPITGRRLVKTWRWDEFWQTACTFYRQLETELETTFFFPSRMVRLLADSSEQNFFQRRITEEFAGLVARPEILLDPEAFDEGLGGFEMNSGGRLNVARFLAASRQQFVADGAYVTADIDLQREIEVKSTGVRLPHLDIQARRLIFCQGIDARDNPWFAHVRFKPAKGEILTLRIAGLAEARIVHRGVWLMPLGNGQFRAGATYEWNELNDLPTDVGREEICSRLRQFLRLPFEVVAQDAAVRPIVLHQYPVVGLHPRWPQLGFLNGLGSKGSLQAPWLANHFAEFLCADLPIDPAVSLSRYEANFQF